MFLMSFSGDSDVDDLLLFKKKIYGDISKHYTGASGKVFEWMSELRFNKKSVILMRYVDFTNANF